MKATRTLALIESTMLADQGASFRTHFAKFIPHAADVFRGYEPPFRPHLGASILGRECAREIFYSFRFATKVDFSGRMLRLFNRGHLEEPRMLAALSMIGVQVKHVDANGKQIKVSGHDGFMGGSLDAELLGIPECPAEPLLGEFKTHGEKSFDKLNADGVIKTKWEHFIQMTMYMGKRNLRGALYMAVNKNTDELYAELVAFDPVQFKRYDERAGHLINASEPPPRINNNPSFFKCKFCDHKEVCHGNSMPFKSCRSCVNSRMGHVGQWWCALDKRVLDVEAQIKGCPSYSPLNFKGKP